MKTWRALVAGLVGAVWMWGGAVSQANVTFVGSKEIRDADFYGFRDGYWQGDSYRNDQGARLFVYFKNTNVANAITITNFTINGTNFWSLPGRNHPAGYTGDVKWCQFWPNPVPAGQYGAVWCYLPKEQETLKTGNIIFAMQTDRGTTNYVFDPEPSPLWVPTIYFTNGLDKAIFYIGNQGTSLLQLSNTGGISINGTAVSGQPLETNLPPGQVIPVTVSGISALVGASTQAIFQVTAADGTTKAFGHMRVSVSTFGVTWWMSSSSADPVDGSNHFCDTNIPGSASFQDEPLGTAKLSPTTVVGNVANKWKTQTATNMAPLMLSLTGITENEICSGIGDFAMGHHGSVEADLEYYLSWPTFTWYLPQDAWSHKETLDIPEAWQSLEDLKYQAFEGLGRGAKNVQWFLYQSLYEQGYGRGGGTDLTRTHQDMTMVAGVANPLLYDRAGRISGVVQMFEPYLLASFPIPDLLTTNGLKVHTLISATNRAVVFVMDERTPKYSWSRPWDYGTPRYSQQVLYRVPVQCYLPNSIYNQVSAAYMVDPFIGVTNVTMSKLGNGQVRLTVPVLEAGAAILLGTASDGASMQTEWALKNAAFSNYCDHARADSLARGWSHGSDWKYPELNYRAVIAVSNTGGATATTIGLPVNLPAERQFNSNAIRVVEFVGNTTNEIAFYNEPQKTYEDWSVNPTSSPARVSPSNITANVRPVYDAAAKTLTYYFTPRATNYTFYVTLSNPQPWGTNRWISADYGSMVFEGDFNSNPFANTTGASIEFDTNADGTVDSGSGVYLSSLNMGGISLGTVYVLSNNWRRYVVDLRKVYQYANGSNATISGQWRLASLFATIAGSDRPTNEYGIVLGKITAGAGGEVLAQPSGGGLAANTTRTYHVYYDNADNAAGVGVSAQFNSGLAGTAPAANALANPLGVEAAGVKFSTTGVGSNAVTLTALSGVTNLILRHVNGAGAVVSEQTLTVSGGIFTATLTQALAATDLLVCIPIQTGGEGQTFCYNASGQLANNAPAGLNVLPERWKAGLDGISYDMDMSPDGQRILICSGSKIRMLDRNGSTLWLKSFPNRTAYARFSSDGNSIYAAVDFDSVRFDDGWRILKYDLDGNLIFSQVAGASETYPGRTVFDLQVCSDGFPDGGVVYTEWNGKAYRLKHDGSVLWTRAQGILYTQMGSPATNGMVALCANWVNFMTPTGQALLVNGTATKVVGEPTTCAIKPDGTQMTFAGNELKLLTTGGVNVATNYIGRNPRVIRYSDDGTRVAAGTCEGNFAFMASTNLGIIWKKKVDGAYVTDIHFLPGTNGVVAAYECFTYQLNSTPSWRYRDLVIAYDVAGNEKWRSEGPWRGQPYMDKLALSTNGQYLAVLTHDAVRLVATTDAAVTNSYLYTAAVDRPVLSPMAGEYNNQTAFSLSVTTANAQIWYTLNGTTPSNAAPCVQYSTPITLGTSTTLRARAFASGLQPSPMLGADILFKAADPVITPPAGGYTNAQTNVTLTCATTGAVIRYTLDGTDPTAGSTVYSTPLSLSANTTLKARAFRSGMTDSDVVRGRFVFNVAANDPRDYPNLMFNGTFEDTLVSSGTFFKSPADWQSTAAGVQDFTVFRTDSASWRFTGPMNSYVFQNLTLVPNTAYTLSAWIKTATALPAGRGLAVKFYDNGAVAADTGFRSSTTWSNISVNFTSSPTHNSGIVRIYFNLNEGEVGWIDDLSLTPVSGVVNTAAPPVISPNGGTFDGPVLVTITSATPNAEIHYTTDGNEVQRWSLLYSGAYLLRTVPNVKAQTQHGGYRFSPMVTSSDFNLRPVYTNGVPFYAIDWRQDADTWWRGHPYNPLGTNYWTGTVRTPGMTVNVATVRSANPTSTTAGIREALNMIATNPAGGVLYFPASGSPYIVTGDLQVVETRDWLTHASAIVTARYYCVTNYYLVNAAIMLLRTSNTFFVGENSSVTIKWDGGHTNPYYRAALFGISSMEYSDSGTMNTGISANAYFKNLTFDGCNSNVISIDVRQASDVLIENCNFINHVPMAAGHPGVVIATCASDNIWSRKSYFQGGQSVYYFDGVHGGGLVECTVTGQSVSVIANLCNDDMLPYSPAPRMSQYMILASNVCNGSMNQQGCNVWAISGGSSLCADNVINGPYFRLFEATGKPSATVPRYRYSYQKNYVRRNRVRDVSELLRVSGWYQDEVMSYYICNDYVESNTCSRGLADALTLAPNNYSGVDKAQVISNVFVRGNILIGTAWPQVSVLRSEVKDIWVTSNVYVGASTNLIDDQTGGTLDTNNIHFADNLFNPLVSNVVMSPGSGYYDAPVQVTLTSASPGAVIRYTTDESVPTAGSPVYTNALRLTNTVILKAMAFLYDDAIMSGVTEQRYSFANAGSRAGRGLIARYLLDEQGGTNVLDTAGPVPAENLRIQSMGAHVWGANGLTVVSNTVMNLTGTGYTYRVTRAITNANAMSLELWLKNSSTNQTSSDANAWGARIVEISQSGDFFRNFALVQKGGIYKVLLQLGSASSTGTAVIVDIPVTTNLAHLVYTRDSAGVDSFYVNGALSQVRTNAGALQWATDRYVWLASSPQKRGWLGRLALVAVYSNALNSAEVGTNYAAGTYFATNTVGKHTLTVNSSYGTPSPAVGVYTNFEGEMLTCTNSASNATYTCTGWTMTGNQPISGGGTAFTLTLTNDAVLNWLWITNAPTLLGAYTNNATPNGNYNSGACWNGGIAPSNTDNAVFNSNAIYRTYLSASVVNSTILFNASTVATNYLDLNGKTLTVEGAGGFYQSPATQASAPFNVAVVSNGTLTITSQGDLGLCANFGSIVLDNVLATNWGANSGISVGRYSSYLSSILLTNGTKVYHNSTLSYASNMVVVGYNGPNGGDILGVYTNSLLATPSVLWIGRSGAQAASSMGHRAIADGGEIQASRIFLGTEQAFDMHNSKLIVTNGGVVRVTDWVKLGGFRGTNWCGRGTNHQVQVHSGWLMATNASGTGLIEITQTNSSLVINGGTVVADQVLETGDATRVTFNSGMLKLTGSGNTSRFNAGLAIPPGGTLEAVGTLAGGAVTNGGILSPAGDGVATTLRFLSNLVLASTSTNEIDMLTTAAFDQLDASGSTITCGGALVVTTNAGWVTPVTGGSYTVLVGTVTGSFSQTNLPAGWTYAAGVVTIPALQCTLTVNSHVGQTQPSGVTTNNKGDSVTAMVTNTPVTAGTTQFVCLGWTGTGSAPASGSTTNTGAFTINTDSTVTWLWATNYWVTNTAVANGAVDWTNGWVRSGSAVQLTAMPNNGYIFAGWAGLGGAASNDNPFRLTVDKPYALTATFAARTALAYTNRATANGDYSVGAIWSSDMVPNYHDTAVFDSNATYRTVLSASVINSNVLYQPTTVATNALDLNGKTLRVRGASGLRLNPANTANAAQNRLAISNGTLEITGYTVESSLCVNWGTLVLDNVLATNFGVNAGIGIGLFSSYNGYMVLTNGTKVYHNSTNVDNRSVTVGYSGQNGGNILTVYTNCLLTTPGLVWIGRGGAAQAASSMGHRAIVDGGVIQANRIFLGTDTAMDMNNSKLIVTNSGVVRVTDWVKLGGFRGTTWCGRGTNHQVQVHSGWLVVTNAAGTGLIEITQTNSALIVNGGTVVADQILETGTATRVTFNSGVLELTGNSNTSRFNAGFSVPAYATLEAVGTLWSPGTVTNAGTLSPAGAQVVGRFIVQTNLVLAASSTNRFDVDASSANDQVDAGNKPVVLGGTLEIWVSPALNNATLSNATYYIITNAASYSGTFANISGGRVSVINNGSFAYATNGNRIVLNNYQGGMRSAPQRPPSGGDDGAVAWAERPLQVTPDGIVLQWQGQPTASFRILRTTNLMGGVWELLTDDVSGVAPLNVYTDLYQDAPVMFYRIEPK